MRKPPKGTSPLPPSPDDFLEEVEDTTVPGSRNAGCGLAQALSTWPVVCMDDLTPPPAWDPTERQLIDNRSAVALPPRAQTEPPRGRLEGVARFLRRLRELPGRRSSQGGDQSGQ